MAVSVNGGVSFWGPYIRDPIIFGNSRMVGLTHSSRGSKQLKVGRLHALGTKVGIILGALGNGAGN